MNYKLLLVSSSVLIGSVLSGCAGLDGSDSYYGNGYDRGRYYDDDYYRERDRDRLSRERWEVERERDRLDNERRRLENERHREREPLRPVHPPVMHDQCPPGFSPRDARCSDSERRHGCKDIRLPSGQGCVKR